MEVMTGEPKMDTGALREYFQPLETWLKEQNRRSGVRVGWGHRDSDVMCSSGYQAKLDTVLYCFSVADIFRCEAFLLVGVSYVPNSFKIF